MPVVRAFYDPAGDYLFLETRDPGFNVALEQAERVMAKAFGLPLDYSFTREGFIAEKVYQRAV